MTSPTRSRSARARHWAAVTATALVAALAPLLGPAAPTSAADGCTSEVQPTAPPLPLPTGQACDDTNPPDTTVTAVTPQPNSNRYVRQDHLTFAFEGSYSDGDQGEISFECQLGTASTPADGAWQPCTSPASYDGLEDSGALPYTFFVRAVDTADAAHDITTDALFPAPTDLPDYDESPAKRQVYVDTVAPNTYVFLKSGYYDRARPDEPMVASPTVQFLLSSNEGGDLVRYRCTLNGDRVGCRDGITTLRGLTPGRKRLVVSAVDPAGNVDPTPYPQPSDSVQAIWVPRNLAAAAPWKRLREGGYFAGDVLETRKVGAQVTAPGRNVRELRLIAPAGPGLGKVQVRIGHTPWRTVNLRAAKYQRFHVYEVRDAYAPLVSGKIRVRVLSVPRSGSVRVDAVLGRR
jgi:hypothetical protein